MYLNSFVFLGFNILELSRLMMFKILVLNFFNLCSVIRCYLIRFVIFSLGFLKKSLIAELKKLKSKNKTFVLMNSAKVMNCVPQPLKLFLVSLELK